MTYLTSLQLMAIIGHIDPFSPIGIAHLYGPKKYSKPPELYSLTNHFSCKCGWKFPCDSMALEINFVLREYMCMTHPLNIPYMDNSKVQFGQLMLGKVKAGQLT